MKIKSFYAILFCIFFSIPLVRAESANIDDLKSRLKEEVDKKSCLSSVPVARQIYALEPEYIPALRAIADCTQSDQNINRYASETKEIFERSKILSIVPKLLEMAQVKDLVPILKEVEVKKDKNISDYLMINEIYERLGDPEKQIATLKQAMDSAPDDPRPILLLASKQFDSGQRAQAEGLFQAYLDRATPHAGRIYLMAYVFALMYPKVAGLCLLGLIWLFALALAYRRTDAFRDWHEARLGMPLFVLIVPPILAFRFWQTGKALPIGALLLIITFQLFFLVKPLLSKVYGPIFKAVGRIIYFVFNGTLLAKKLAALTTGSRVLISFFTLVILTTIAPTVESPDLRYGLIIVCSLVMYATIGSLMVTFMHSRESLVTSLRWIGIASTFPFLISYLVSNWGTLGTPLLYAEMPSHQAIDSLVSYMLFWGVSVFLAIHLGKIIAQAFSQPITEMVEKVAMIEKGHFDAKVRVFSNDEIGLLGHAINRMGEGLGKREKIEKTFRKYVDSAIAERILDGVETEVRVEGQSVNAVVLFADIRGFTSLSEKISPQEVVKLLNQFYERMVKTVRLHQGVIDKFIGDNLMAVWGVPCAIEEAEIKAVSAALDMLNEIKEWNLELKAQGYSEIGIGIGINTGPLVAGSIGSTEYMEYTVIGDTVNTAQRVESTAKPQQLVITEAMYLKVKSKIEAVSLEPLMVKGKTELQQRWQVTGFAKSDSSLAA